MRAYFALLNERKQGQEEELWDFIDCCLLRDKALTEKGPCKAGMSHEKSISITTNMVNRGEPDGKIVQDIDIAMGNN